ncbi:TPA: hypothetical protein ACHK65_005174, partial [Escherichia coli]
RTGISVACNCGIYMGWIIMNQQNNIKRNFLQSLRNTTVLLLDIALIESLKTINSDQEQIKKYYRLQGHIFLKDSNQVTLLMVK